MKQILQDILAKNSTVILPHLGAIIKLGESYQFNEFLKYNDGKLITAVEESKKVDKDEATEIVSDFIRAIKESLNANEAYSLDKLGSLTNKGGKTVLLNNKATSDKVKNKDVEEKIIPSPNLKKDEETKTELPATEAKIVKEIAGKETPSIPTSKDVVKEKAKIKEIIEKTPPIPKEIVADKEKSNLAKAYTSSNLVTERAIEKVESFTNVEELKSFGKGEKRTVVLETIQTKIKSFTKSGLEKTASILAAPINHLEDKKKEEVIELDKKEVKKESVAKVEEKPIVPLVAKKEEAKEAVKKVEEKVVGSPIPKVNTKKDDEIKEKLVSGAIVIEKEAKKRKRNRFILWAAIILLLLGSTIIGYLQKDRILSLFSQTELAETEHKDSKSIANNNHGTKEEHSDSGTHNTKEEGDSNADHTNAVHEEEGSNEAIESEDVSSVEEEAAEMDPEVEVVEEVEIVEEIIVEEEAVATTLGGKYNIVVGSFSDKGNAEKLVEKLKSDGYSNAKILPKTGSLTAVSIANFDSRSDAKSTLKEIKGKGYSGWIKKIK